MATLPDRDTRKDVIPVALTPCVISESHSGSSLASTLHTGEGAGASVHLLQRFASHVMTWSGSPVISQDSGCVRGPQHSRRLESLSYIICPIIFCACRLTAADALWRRRQLAEDNSSQ